MIGKIDDRSRALLDVQVGRTTNARRSRVTVWIDTAFDGHLVFPRSLIESLQLESLADEKLFHRVGLLQIGQPEGYVVGGVLTAAKRHGLAVDQLSAAQSQHRFPGFHVPAGLYARCCLS